MSDRHDDENVSTTAETPVGEEPSLVAGRYRIRRTLGKGGGGHVWLAQDEKLGREVALKRVGGETDAEVLLTRGMREARTSATLAHENVVRVYDAFEHDGFPWIVMEYVPGPSLAELLEDGQRLPVDQVATIGAQLATALAAAHGAGILHRDVKPGNVLLRDEAARDAKLTDFGIARAEEDHQLTRTGFVSGTAAYFAPELARGEEPSTASDVWALGATLYLAVEGRRPFTDRPNAVAQLHTIAREQPRPPEQAGPLATVLAGMLDPDPTTRWDAARAARELEAVAGAGAGAVPPGPHRGAGAPWTPSAGDATQAVRPPDATRAIAHGRADRGPVAAPAAPRQDRGTAYQRPARKRRQRRTAMWLGWLLVIPLLVALGWLVWTITDGVRSGDGTGTSASQTDSVGAGEARELAEEFYARLENEGLASARELTTEDAFIDGAIADDLTSVEVLGLEAVENPDGSATVTARVDYFYGPNLYAQAESLRVERVDGTPLIVSRRADEVPIGDDAESTG